MQTTFTPSRMNQWMEHVCQVAKLAAAASGWTMPEDEAPLAITMDFYFLRPKSGKKYHRFKVTRPDNTNLVKAAEDALVWAGVIRDDNQVADGPYPRKLIDDGWQGAVITITVLEQPQPEKRKPKPAAIPMGI